MKRGALVFAAILVVMGLATLEIVVGSAHIPLPGIMRALRSGPTGHDFITKIVWSIRVPRCLLAFLTGATLASAGALLQASTRNPLADPFLFGLSSGAATGAVAMLVFAGDILGVWTSAIGAAAGALLATIGLLLLISATATGRSRIQNERVLLSGLAISFIFSTLTNLMIFWGDRNTAQSILFWTMGSFASARWLSLPVALVGLLLVLTYGWHARRGLDALMAGEETARSLGIDTRRMRMTVLSVCAFSTAMTVSLCGPVAFIGLIVPHMARQICGASLYRSYGWTPALGGILAMLADLVSKCLLPSQEIPVGIVISALGAGFLIALMVRKTA